MSASIRALLRAALLGVAGLAYTLPALAAPVPDDPFPRPPELRTAIDFWKAIYTRYSVHDIVFHHPDHLDVVYKVLDLSAAAEGFANEDAYRAFRRDQVRAEKEEIVAQLEALAELPANAPVPEYLQSMALLLQPVDAPAPQKYRDAAKWVRAQRGLRETFMEALRESGRYLPYIESVFAEAGLPKMLTRLPFVESSFNRKAYSRSGAAGIWQFMPGSAREYMRYDEVADQRRDPWFSTHAAAGHLKDDYELLQDWPLAVTAYNYGRNGLARAREETGLDSLTELIAQWDGPRFGFAAKNFYASFLAAVESEQAAPRLFGPIDRAPVTLFDEITTPAYIDWNTLLANAGVDEDTFRDLNPSFSRAVRDGGLLVPAGQVLRLPRGKGRDMARALATLPASLRHSRQRSYFVDYRVRPGDALSRIAERYRSSVSAIVRSNNLRSASRIRAGQVLRIPTGSGGAGPASTHRVSAGETLWEIARRYGTSVSALMADNNIGSAARLQIGQTLRVRGGVVRSHTVRGGETLSGIARRYGTSVAQIKRDNGLRDADFLRVGQTLRLGGAAAAPRAPLQHRVRSGQTLEAIARRYGVSMRSLVRHNQISNPNQIRSGQVLAIPHS